MNGPDPFVNPPGSDGTSLGAGAIEAYTRALRLGKGGRPELWYREWLADDSAADLSDVAKLRTLDLLFGCRPSLKALWQSPGSDDPTEVLPLGEDPRPPEISAPSSPAELPAFRILNDEAWLKSNLLVKIGYLDTKQGGMGEIALAWHLKMRKQVILKLAMKEKDKLRFEREIGIHPSIDDHQNILTSRSPLEYRGASVLVVDYIKGLDLRRWVRLNGPMPWRESCDCIKQAAMGLGHAHSRGVIHRDVKSSNLLRADRDGRILVIDWGLAFEHDRDKSLEGLTETGQGVGTPAYLSPEQARDARLATPASDLYGLGCVWFELLTGKAPFDVPSDQIREAHANAAVPPLPEALGVPEPVEKVLRKLLAKEPERRYASAETLIADLDRAIEPEVRQKTNPTRRLILQTAVGLPLLAWLGWTLLQPVHVRKFVVSVTDPSGHRGFRKELGKDVFEAHEGDELRITTELSWPAFAYLIAFSPDGQMKLCDPSEEKIKPVRTRSPIYPPPSKDGEVYTLNNGPGLQTFALVWSKNPLPDFETWRSQQRDCPWTDSRRVNPGVVWWFDGQKLDPLEPGKGNEVRGGGTISITTEGQLGQLKKWLQERPEIDGVVFKAFSVLPTEAKP